MEKLGPIVLAVACALGSAVSPALAQSIGTWTKAPTNPATGAGAFGLWLLTDGTVLSHGNGLNQWVILTPDKKGNYATGTWKSVAASAHARSGATQHVLKDGRFFQAGGEYIDGPDCTAALCPTAEIYDPVANKWTNAATAPYDIGDTGSATLADGRLIYSTRAGNMIQIYDPTTDAWTKSGTMPLGNGDENSWATLQNGGILAVGYQSAGAAIYNPATSTWKRTGAVPSGFNTGDTGGITQMFDGRVFVYGLNFHSYIYTPGATPDDAGSWVEGPKLLDTEAEDEYTDILPNGLVIGGLVHIMFGPGTIIQLFDPTTNTASQLAPANNDTANVPIDYLNLPNGQVMVTGGNADYLLTLSTGPQDDWRPTVTSVVYDATMSSYTLTGTQLSGLVNGADEGDDMTMAQNYPIVWLTDDSGNVYYCRSFDFSNMMPSKGSTPETCTFTTPAGLPAGSYSLYVSAVGVPSKDPFPFTVGQSTTGAGGTSGGSAGAGGTAGSSGAAGGITGIGGMVGGTGGMASTGTGGAGSGGTGGMSTTGTGGRGSGGAAGVTGTGGAIALGSGGQPSTSGSGGKTAATGGAATGGTTMAGASGGAGVVGATSGGGSGCSCTTAPGATPSGAFAAMILAGLTCRRRRSRR